MGEIRVPAGGDGKGTGDAAVSTPEPAPRMTDDWTWGRWLGAHFVPTRQSGGDSPGASLGPGGGPLVPTSPGGSQTNFPCSPSCSSSTF